MKYIRPRNLVTAGATVLRSAVVAGTTANTNIAVTGILVSDVLAAVVRLNRDATAANIDISDVRSEASITSNGNIQLSTTNTTGDSLLVLWQPSTL